ncbi:MAG: diguanylate cyclase [Pseudomonadota bacterium]
MGWFRKKNTDIGSEVEKLNAILQKGGPAPALIAPVVVSLLEHLKDFSLNVEELPTKEFRARVDALAAIFSQALPEKDLREHYSAQRGDMVAFIRQQNSYIGAREKEFREIIDLLTEAITGLKSGNEDLNVEVSASSDVLEAIIRLDDIKKIKDALRTEVMALRMVIQEKESRDQNLLDHLSEQVKTLNVELEKALAAAQKDGLTGVFNRKAFDVKLRQFYEKARGGGGFCLLMVDIDDFKAINDTYGHPLGDRVLVSVVHKCRQCIRNEDVLARYGGEEFAVILAGASLRNATKRAKQICKAIAATRYTLDAQQPDIELSVTVSIGVGTARAGDTPEALIARADMALYQAKKTGKNKALSEKEVP